MGLSSMYPASLSAACGLGEKPSAIMICTKKFVLAGGVCPQTV